MPRPAASPAPQRRVHLRSAVSAFTWRRLTYAAARFGLDALGAAAATTPARRWRQRCAGGATAALEDAAADLGEPGDKLFLRAAWGGYLLGRTLLGTAEAGPDGLGAGAVQRRLRPVAARLDCAGVLDALHPGLDRFVTTVAAGWVGPHAHPVHGDVLDAVVDVFAHGVGVAALEAELAARYGTRPPV